MKIKVPKELRIGSYTYKVVLDGTQGDDGYFGSHLPHRMEVRLDPKMHHQQMRTTYIHEAVHAICKVFELRPSDEDVCRLAEGLGELLFNNLSIDLDFGSIPEVKRTIRDVK